MVSCGVVNGAEPGQGPADDPLFVRALSELEDLLVLLPGPLEVAELVDRHREIQPRAGFPRPGPVRSEVFHRLETFQERLVVVAEAPVHRAEHDAHLGATRHVVELAEDWRPLREAWRAQAPAG